MPLFTGKGSGHATNPGLSSTPGVHISMSRFSEINYDAATKTIDVGAGCVGCTQIHHALHNPACRAIVQFPGFLTNGRMMPAPFQYGIESI